MRKICVVAMFAFMSMSVFGQQTIKIMSYNLLNFPQGSLVSRQDTLKKLINYVQPDLFLIQELKTEAGLQLVVNESFSDLPGTYVSSTFVVQQSSPNNPNKLQQAIVYNSDVLGLANEGFIMTAVRDINRYKLYWKNPELINGADTVFFYVFVTHLKSSQGSDNVAARLEMVQSFTAYQGVLPQDASVVFAGDFNLYNSTEPAYEELLDPTNDVVLLDPIDSPGNWHSSSFQPKSILTQSTRSSQIFGDGAGGGVDDRFDFVLLSSNMFNGSNSVQFVENSYAALGNNGTCYNQSITSCSATLVSSSILSALYYMSDHLPVVLELNVGVGSVGVEETLNPLNNVWINGSGNIEIDHHLEGKFSVEVFDLFGRSLFAEDLYAGENVLDISKTRFSKGIYLIRVSGINSTFTKRVFFE